MDILGKWISFGGALLAVVLTVLKIIEHLRNKPILIFDCNPYCFDSSNGATDLIVFIEITNVGTKATIIKKYLVYLLDQNKNELAFFGSRLFEMGIKLHPGDYREEWINIRVKRELPDEKYYFRIVFYTSYQKYTRLIPFDRCD